MAGALAGQVESPPVPSDVSPLQAAADKKAAKAQIKADHIKGSVPTRPIKFGANAVLAYGHKKIYMAERENVGTEAAHKGELSVEAGLRKAYRHHKTKPYRKVEKLSKKTTKLNAKASYRKAVADNPRLQKSITSRVIQKRKIQREYAKAVREGKKTGGTLKRAANRIGKAVEFIAKVVFKNPKVIAVIGAILLFITVIVAAFSACVGMVSSIGNAIVATSHLAESIDIDDASIAYTELETELRVRLGNIATEFPDFDEYRINTGNIDHNPLELMAFLTAAHHDFSYPEIREVLQGLFDAQYQLVFTPSVEIRHHLNDADELVPYVWYVLAVTLTARSFTEVINERMNDSQRQHHALLIQSGGNRQYVGSPFPFDWRPYISSHYGWRIHPISREPAFHTGIDIGLPTGTEILAAHGGIVTFAGYNGGYGNFIIIEGTDGTITRYAHCDTILVTAGQEVSKGDVIGTVGSTGNSTGPHLHFEVIRNNSFLNPIFFSLITGGVQ